MAVGFIGEKNRVSGENHRPAASHWQTVSHNVVSSTPRLRGTTFVAICTDLCHFKSYHGGAHTKVTLVYFSANTIYNLVNMLCYVNKTNMDQRCTAHILIDRKATHIIHVSGMLVIHRSRRDCMVIWLATTYAVSNYHHQRSVFEYSSGRVY